MTALLLSALGVPTTANHDGCEGEVIDIGGGTPTGSITYVSIREAGTGGVSIWFYLEGNGEPGLQAGGSHPLEGVVPGFHFKDECDHPNPDVLLL